MINKIKAHFEKQKQAKLQKVQLLKMQKYYGFLKAGAVFLQFIEKDLEKTSNDKMNRKKRRRFQKDLEKRGKFNKEIIEHYAKQIDTVLMQMEKMLNPPKKPVVKTVKE